MEPNRKRILELIRRGEGIDVEFKTCRHQLTRDAYETVCAFLNRYGGTLLLGVQDSGDICGIDPEVVSQLKKDFVTAINNPQKITPPTYLSIDEVQIKDKRILHIFVTESSQVHRCNGRIFDRNEHGDLDITDNTAQVAHLYQRKQATYTENKVYPNIQVKDLRPDLIEKCRRYVRINKKNHPWSDMDDLALLKSAQLYLSDPHTNEQGVTLAGVLLFGPDQLILSVCPAHRTDLILRKVNVDRYDDRDLVRTNLVDSYDRILAFVQKHLSDPFHLEGIERKSLRDAIFREVASNMLIHREYTNATPARLIIEYSQVNTYNANRPHGFGRLDPEAFTPYPKNPVIGAFFREIERADELGSGMRNMMKYGRKYGGGDPQLIEGDIFRMIISVPEFGTAGKPSKHDEAHDKAHDKAHDEAHVTLTEIEQQMLQACQQAARSTPELLEILGYKSRTGNFKKALSHLLADKFLERTLPNKPRSKNQKYRITSMGEKILENIR